MLVPTFEIILTWYGSGTWSLQSVIIEAELLSLSTTLHAVVVMRYCYDFDCTQDTEFLIAWICALAPNPHPIQLKLESLLLLKTFKRFLEE